MLPHEEAANILVRMLDTIGAGMGKRLKEEHKAEIRRACALLATDGTMQPLDDLPRVTPGCSTSRKNITPSITSTAWKGKEQ